MESDIFHLQPWTPRIQEVANELISDVHEIAPELKMLFMGAAALGLPGKNDIDLDILCDKKNIAAYTKKLKNILGEPKDTKNDLTTWGFQLKGYEVDAILSDPTTSHVPEQQKVFERLKADSSLLSEYRDLKESCDGLPYSEYEMRKKAFFNERVLLSS